MPAARHACVWGVPGPPELALDVGETLGGRPEEASFCSTQCGHQVGAVHLRAALG